MTKNDIFNVIFLKSVRTVITAINQTTKKLDSDQTVSPTVTKLEHVIKMDISYDPISTKTL